PYRFVALRQPGIELLTELVGLVHARPAITTGALLETFDGRDEETALQKLATQGMPGDESLWRDEFRDTMAQLDRQTLQQRVDELQALVGEGALDAAGKDELRALLQRGRG
ncbi:MAG TPA: DNA primase, partial [Luteimonas sp.]|nr:DNA primase [Luteimonas sp.]